MDHLVPWPGLAGYLAELTVLGEVVRAPHPAVPQHDLVRVRPERARRLTDEGVVPDGVSRPLLVDAVDEAHVGDRRRVIGLGTHAVQDSLAVGRTAADDPGLACLALFSGDEVLALVDRDLDV